MQNVPIKKEDPRQHYLLDEDGTALILCTNELITRAHISFHELFLSLSIEMGDYEGAAERLSHLEKAYDDDRAWMKQFLREASFHSEDMKHYEMRMQEIISDLMLEDKVYEEWLMPMLSQEGVISKMDDPKKIETLYSMRERMQNVHNLYVKLLRDIVEMTGKLADFNANLLDNFLKTSKKSMNSFVFDPLKREKGTCPVSALHAFAAPFLPIPIHKTWSLSSIMYPQRRKTEQDMQEDKLLKGQEQRKTYSERKLLPKIFEANATIALHLETYARAHGTDFTLKAFVTSFGEEQAAACNKYFFDFWMYAHADRTIPFDAALPEIRVMKETAPSIQSLSVRHAAAAETIQVAGFTISDMEIHIQWRNDHA